jgi:hypothetical protein
MNKDGFYGSGAGMGATPIGGGVGIGVDPNKRIDHLMQYFVQRTRSIDDRLSALESGHGLFDRCQITDKLIFNKQREIEELKKDKEFWMERAGQMEAAYADIRWLFDNQPLVEKQTARSCLGIVTKIKNDPLTVGEGKRWMVAVCEDIEKAIKKDFDLR